MTEIIFKDKDKELYSIGRNGAIRTTGVAIFDGGNNIVSCPITSRGKIGNCSISIDKNDLHEIINELTKLL